MKDDELLESEKEMLSVEKLLSRRIKNWADRVYPNRTPEVALAKMIIEEIPELLNGGLDDPLEWADVLILLIDSADLRGIDIFKAAFEKMDLNENRQWVINPKTGIMRSIK